MKDSFKKNTSSVLKKSHFSSKRNIPANIGLNCLKETDETHQFNPEFCHFYQEAIEFEKLKLLKVQKYHF